MWGIIGGSGFEKFTQFRTINAIDNTTPFGETSSGASRVAIDEYEALFIPRHGSQHEKLPSEVNYRANIFALKRAGAKAILSISAVGSLRESLQPGHLVIPHQYIDQTKGIRAHTFCGDGVVGHVSLAHPVCHSMTDQLAQSLTTTNINHHVGQTYICIEGPMLSSAAASKTYRILGADIVGMTNFPEVALAREAGLPYLPCCFVCDYDAWSDTLPAATLEDIINIMQTNNLKAFDVVRKAVASQSTWFDACNCSEQGLTTALMTAPENIPEDKAAWLNILCKN